MNRSPILALVGLLLTGVIATRLPAQTPADTYFSLAVTENSHNHVGAKLLHLDFQEAPFTLPDQARGEVAAIEVAPGSIVLDGDAADWDPTWQTTVHGLVQNNYPLSEFIDAVETDITVGAAWDTNRVYFLLQWEDAGHDESTRLKKWTFGDQGGAEMGWNQQLNTGATSGAPNASVVNASGHELHGAESEDRAFLMFPIVDTEANFVPGGPGCAFYCHTELLLDDPFQNYTGLGFSAMHTNVPGDTADVWHWKAARTEPSGYADDKWIEFATGHLNGRRSDAGSAAYSGNELAGVDPTWMHVSGLSYTGEALFDFESVPFSGAAGQGDQIPRNRSVQPLGSRADVETAASFDAGSGTWTLEIRRLLDTGNADDHSFLGSPLAPPTETLVTSTSVSAGDALNTIYCLTCHGVDGIGWESGGGWIVPRSQRTSGSRILRALATIPVMGGLGLTEQEAEDVAAFLQTKGTFSVTPGAWQDLGDGLAGTNGLPVLDGLGTLIGGDPVTLSLSNALQNTTAGLVVGIAQLNGAFKGGVMVPDPLFIVTGLPTGPTGSIVIPSTWPTGFPPSFTTFFQYWITDAAGPKGFAASNALAGTTP